jgi:hypothetical protein
MKYLTFPLYNVKDVNSGVLTSFFSETKEERIDFGSKDLGNMLR